MEFLNWRCCIKCRQHFPEGIKEHRTLQGAWCEWYRLRVFNNALCENVLVGWFSTKDNALTYMRNEGYCAEVIKTIYVEKI